MAKMSKSLQLMALKLGLTEEDKVLSKASEFERLLQMKSSFSNITDTAKTVICLDLAASYLNVGVDLKTAVKCSGLRSPSYTNCRKILENILELNNERVTVSSLCLSLQCNVEDLALKILEEYSKTAKMDLDMNLPQYVCMAVRHACRLSKVKISKSKLMEKCRLRPAQWSKLDAEWTKFTDDKFVVAKKNRGRPTKSSGSDVEKMEVDSEVADKNDEQSEVTVEPYEEWRRRILEEAYKHIGQESPKQYLNKRKESTQNDYVNAQKGNKQKVNEKLLEEPYKQIEQKSPKQYYNKGRESKQNVFDITQKSQQKKVNYKLQVEAHKQIEQESPKQYYNKRKEAKLNYNDFVYKENHLVIEDENIKQYHNKRKESKQNEKGDTLKVNESPIKDIILNFSPRRSPRKTPHKFVPYTSPVKPKGVRLLFP